MKRSKRFEILENRPVHNDGFVKEWPEVGLIAIGSPNDPIPSVKVESGKIVEMDGKKREEFDFIDTFLADHAINIENTEKAMAIDSMSIARMLTDINVSRDEIIKITTALTPAKLVEVVDKLNVVEMMMALQKMRARRTPSNQCHVTNVRDNPVQIAADAAESALRGFDEMETTVGIVRYAPFNALSIMVGGQVGRPGILTQCSLEEATELKLGMLGYTAYAETISVYGTENVFVDGDDTPYSKAFLASAYASRGLKMRFQQLVKDIQIKSIQSQLNPHFLFNTLNTIACMALMESSCKTAELIYALSDILRYSLKNSEDMVQIGVEIENIKKYLFIQTTRYINKLSYDIKISDEILKYKIPAMTLQPLIENAIIHGLERKNGPGTIEILGDIISYDSLLIKIIDDGVGMTEEQLNILLKNLNSSASTSGIGIKLVHDRLSYYFGSEFGVNINSIHNVGTTLYVKLPIIN